MTNYGMTTKQQQDKISVIIMSPDAVLWEGDVLSLASTNSEGDFDILPDHARFMSIIEKKPIVLYQKNGMEQSFTFDNAVLFFQDNSAKIYTHQAE